MKQKDIATIVAAVCASAVISFFLSGLVISASTNQLKGLTVDKISPAFNVPDATYFNTNSLDPTQLIHIGTNSNSNPFSAQ